MFTRGQRRGRRRVKWGGVVALAVLGSVIPGLGTEGSLAFAGEGAASSPAVTPEAKASAAAAASGERVLVDAATTESSQVFANPDATFTQEMNASPVRAQQSDGTWASIDTSLQRGADGFLRAKNTTADVAFSGGGSGSKLVTLEDDGYRLQLGWPTTLPTPRLDGATATYPDVLPDVDLKLTALSSGYTSVLVVKTAQAAKDPALATIKMSVTSSGLDVAPTADGGFVARNGDGTPVFESPAGRMWDSAGDSVGTVQGSGPTTQLLRTASTAVTRAGAAAEETSPLPEAGGEPTPLEGPGNGDAAAAVPLKVTSSTLEITPDPALLHGDDTVFPLYIDPPTKGITLGDWTALASNGTKYWKFDEDKGVGRCSNYAGYLCSNSPYNSACTSSTRSPRSTARRSWTRRSRCTRRGRSPVIPTGTT